MKNKKISVLQIIPSLVSGGLERETVDIASNLTQNGFLSYVASSGGPMLSNLYHGGSKHFNLPLNSKNPFVIYNNFRDIVKLIKQHEIDIIHAKSRSSAWSAYFAAKVTGKKFVTTFHAIYKNLSIYKKYFNSIMTKGEIIVAISDFIFKHLVDDYNVSPEKIKVIPSGVDMEYFDPSKVGEERIVRAVKKMHIQTDKSIILMPGKLTHWKGHKFLLEALRQIEKEKFYCIMVSNDSVSIDYRREIESIISNYKLTDNVALVTNLNDMPALYMLADVVISASIEPEAFAKIVTEAQAMGKIVIATNIGGACETIVDGKTGFLVEPNNVDQLAKTIDQALSSSLEKSTDNLKILREHIANHFSKKLMCERTLSMYKVLMKES